jgi:hypothetical protein
MRSFADADLVASNMNSQADCLYHATYGNLNFVRHGCIE